MYGKGLIFYLMRGLLGFLIVKYINRFLNNSTQVPRILQKHLFYLPCLPCSLKHSIFKCWGSPSSGHNYRLVALNLEEIMQCFGSSGPNFFKTLKYWSSTFKPNFFLLIYWEVLEIIEEASMISICNMNWLVMIPCFFHVFPASI